MVLKCPANQARQNHNLGNLGALEPWNVRPSTQLGTPVSGEKTNGWLNKCNAGSCCACLIGRLGLCAAFANVSECLPVPKANDGDPVCVESWFHQRAGGQL